MSECVCNCTCGKNEARLQRLLSIPQIMIENPDLDLWGAFIMAFTEPVTEEPQKKRCLFLVDETMAST
jgi:hypothetical protein